LTRRSRKAAVVAVPAAASVLALMPPALVGTVRELQARAVAEAQRTGGGPPTRLP
jgi:hypothetical protein